MASREAKHEPNDMKHYIGQLKGDGTCHVRVQEGGEDGTHSRALPLRLDLSNHSPTGFAWGYSGSGPAQLALALIADATGDDKLALRLHQQFKLKYVTTWRRDLGWHLSQVAVLALVAHLAEREARL